MKQSIHTRPSSRQRILVLGYVVRRPFGGQAWHYLQYLVGAARLGHEVYYLEDSSDFADCLNPFEQVYGADPKAGLTFLQRVLNRFGLGECWAYYDAHTNTWSGPCHRRVPAICGDADTLWNISGLNPLRPWFEPVRRKVLIDTDPAFTQIRHLTQHEDPYQSLWTRNRVAQHTAYFTFGENFGKPGCTIPDDGFPWQPTRQPIVLEHWPVAPPCSTGRLTTVMSWKTYSPRRFRGVKYGVKRESFENFWELPSRVSVPIELVLTGKDAPRERLSRQGWHLADPNAQAADPWQYQEYLQQSKAEFSLAKQGYVMTHSGWFSERSAGYLASGRPVVVQETGFSDWLPLGEGVWSFENLPQAVNAIETMSADYRGQCAAARALAEDYFDSDKLLTSLIDRSEPGARAKERT